MCLHVYTLRVSKKNGSRESKQTRGGERNIEGNKYIDDV